MKAIILAAGEGTRLKKYTNMLPKGMLYFNGKTLIDHQIRVLKAAGINDIIIVTGFMADKIKYDGLKYYVNQDYATTNMVESLFCAESEMNDDFIVCYADIIYEKRIIEGLINAGGEIIVTVDKNWEKYWKARYGDITFDIESLSLNDDGTIKELGKEVYDVDNIDARFVGLLKFSNNGINILKETYHNNKKLFWDKPWQISGKIFKKAYMTDLIQEFIDNNIPVHSFIINNGWIEFDTNEDYERMLELLRTNKLNSLIDLTN